MRLKNAKKYRRIHLSEDTYERLSNIIGIDSINKEDIINRLIDSWENSIYNTEAVYHYDKAMKDFENKYTELKVIFERTIKDSFFRYEKVVTELTEMKSKEALAIISDYLEKEIKE